MDLAFALLFKLVIGLVVLSSGLIGVWRAWSTTGRIGRIIVVALAVIGAALLMTGIIWRPDPPALHAIGAWWLIGWGAASYLAIGCWILWRSLAHEGLPPGLLAAPDALEKLNQATLDLTSAIRNLPPDRNDD